MNRSAFIKPDGAGSVALRHRYLRLGALQLFIGLGGIFGGWMLVTDPDGSNLQLPLRLLEHSPFRDYFFPGLILLIVNGIGSCVAGVLSLLRMIVAGTLGVILGGFLVAWILVQVVMIREVGMLHVACFLLGVWEILMGWRLRISLRKPEHA
jgi:hypothetical protein